jgi:8-oxo-dGTP diphosphatase
MERLSLPLHRKRRNRFSRLPDRYPGTRNSERETGNVIDWAVWQPQECATLCFVRQSNRILLIRKKRGLGAGKINGVGGRLEPGEAPETGVVREAQEELLITPLDCEKRGELHFQFLSGYSLFCTVFVASRFSGTPTETAEATPLWFNLHALPFDEMWAVDRLWLGQALEGHNFRGYFVFDDDRMINQHLDWLDGASPSEAPGF